MINRINEKIYNYIFSVNAELRYNDGLNIKEFEISSLPYRKVSNGINVFGICNMSSKLLSGTIYIYNIGLAFDGYLMFRLFNIL